jgi:hypothetical protein
VSGAVVVRVPITPAADTDWVTIFNSGPPAGVTYFPGMAPPTATAGYVQFKCGSDDVAKHYEQAKNWVEGTNNAYVRDVIPARERRARQLAEHQARKKKMLEDAKRRLSELDG